MTDKTFQQLQQRIDSLKLSVDKADIIAGLKARLESVRATRVIADFSKVTEKNIQEKAVLENANELSADFRKLMLEKFEHIEEQIRSMRPALLLPAEPSLAYEKITNTRVKNQLLADNIRMEHALLDTQVFIDFGEELAFRRFCAFAFFQVEEMLNFYYHNKFGIRMNEMRREFASPGYGIKPAWIEKAKKISDVAPWILIKAYNYEFYESKSKPKTWGLDNLRNVRNLEQHRCAVLLENKELAKLEQEYSQLKSRRESTLDTSGNPAKPTGREYAISQDIYTIKFILNRRASNVRSELENLYKNVTK